MKPDHSAPGGGVAVGPVDAEDGALIWVKLFVTAVADWLFWQIRLNISPRYHN